MKKLWVLFCFIGFGKMAWAQQPGDTIMVNSFNYSQTYGGGNRDTMLNFPNLPGVTFEKIYMLYNMRCKNGLVSPGTPGQTNLGCGEWDYSCNSYITDSSRTDSVKATFPTHVIKGFSGTVYPYTLSPTYTYYEYHQKQVIHNSVITEMDTTIGLGNYAKTAPLTCQAGVAKNQFLWTAAELTVAGITPGDISSIKLNLLAAGSAAKYLRIRMKHTTQTVLNAANPELTGFTEVYFLNTTLSAGLNEFNFYNNFTWNGTDNILIEFTFDNALAGTNSMVLCDSLSNTMGLVAEGQDYSIEFTGSNFAQLGNSNFGNFSNQLSIAFWSNGNSAVLPTNTSVLYATDASNNRQLNIHFPWSDSNIYWDAGSNGPYDRINKVATPAEFAGNWNYWVFTKNTATGSMKIYLNGTLWHSGAGKTIPIQISNFQLGNQHGLNNPYFGKIDEFTLWNTELSAANIQNWMRRPITPAHPAYANLMAHYAFNEGSGNVTADNSTVTDTATLVGSPLWRRNRAVDIFKGFAETVFRPTLTFVQGTYNQTITSITILDSVVNNPNTVYSYMVAGHAAVPYDTTISYTAGYVYKYDGETGALLDSTLIAPDGTVNIGTLNFYKTYPSRFQIMSFVTPYGIGLNLGPNGKTWTFDLSDLEPILKGRKRMTIDAGGQWQEDLDIRFMFIVGTPPHDVKQVANIWKVDNVGYGNILNDRYFEPRMVHFDANSVAYKIRTAITGHGQDGEFIPRQHYINIAGGARDFNWNVWKACASNPIYPQGGTWIYDRAGWCPGAPTDIQEFDITPLVTPGSSDSVDYGIDVVSGASNYWVSSQLVSYGPPNHTLDAAVYDIQSPTQKVEYLRTNTICTDPTIVIQNTGSTTLTSLVIEYWINNSSQRETYTWNGSLAFLATATVVLPAPGTLWSSITGTTNNVFHVEIKNPNGAADTYTFNNFGNSTFDIPPVHPGNFILFVRTNLFGSETSYQLLDAAGTPIVNRANLLSSKSYSDTLNLSPGCYSLRMYDSDDDGIDFWANNDGVGQCRFKNLNGSTLKSFEGDFGHYFIYNFTVDYPLAYDKIAQPLDESIGVYPNPATNSFTVTWNSNEVNHFSLYNSMGQMVNMPSRRTSEGVVIDGTNFPKGLYIIKVTNDAGHEKCKKIILE